MDILHFINVVILISILISFWWFKYYLSGYLNKKAINLATKEDFNKLLELEKKSTKELESIKGQISNHFWIDQKAWGLKREGYTKLLKKLNQVRELSAHIADSYDSTIALQLTETEIAFYEKQKKKQMKAIRKLGNVTATYSLICGENVIYFLELYRNDSCKLADSENIDALQFHIGLRDLSAKTFLAILTAARQDLLGNLKDKIS